MQHYWWIAIHKTYWIPGHLHDIVDPEHIITKQKLLFHHSKLLLTKLIILSHLYLRSVAPLKAPPSAKCTFPCPAKLKKFHKTVEVDFTTIWSRYDANYTINTDHCTGIFKKSLHLLPFLNVEFLQPGLQEICCFLECHPTCQFRMLFLPVLDAVYCAACTQNWGKPLSKTTS